jgi:hypothetical protein
MSDFGIRSADGISQECSGCWTIGLFSPSITFRLEFPARVCQENMLHVALAPATEADLI